MVAAFLGAVYGSGLAWVHFPVGLVLDGAQARPTAVPVATG
jgi:hypothetical protein